MSDLLAEVDDLSTLLDETVDVTQGVHVLSLATAAVQAAAGQWLLEVTETLSTMGTVESWLILPERPVTDVTSVEVDGEAVTDYKRFGYRLWRSCGWASSAYEPSEVSIAHTHGKPAGDPYLELAKAATLVVAVGLMEDPTSNLAGMSVDDYREQRVQTSEPASLVPKSLAKALRKHYGSRAGLVKLG